MKTKTMTTWISALAVAGLLVGAGAIVTIPRSGESLERHMQGPRRHGLQGPSHGAPFGAIFRELDLTEEQRQAIRESLAAERESHQDLRERLLEARKALHDAALRGEHESILSQLAQNVGKVESEMALARAKQFASLVALLEPEQKAKLEELQAQMESRREERQERFRNERQEQQQQ